MKQRYYLRLSILLFLIFLIAFCSSQSTSKLSQTLRNNDNILKQKSQVYQNKIYVNKNHQNIQQYDKGIQQSQQNFYLIQQLNLKEQQQVIQSFSSLQGSTYNQITLITIAQGNRIFIFRCNQNMTKCYKYNSITVDQNFNIYASALSDDQSLLVVAGSNSIVYVYKRVYPESTVDFSFTLNHTLNDFKNNIKAIRMGTRGVDLWIGGSQKIVRFYTKNNITGIYELVQTFPLTPSQIIAINYIQETAFRNQYIFICCQSLTMVYLLNSTEQKYDYQFSISSQSTSVFIPTVYVSGNNDGVIALGTFTGSVKLYQFIKGSNNLTLVQQIKGIQIGQIISLSFNTDGQYLVIGNHNYATYIYKKSVNSDGTYIWSKFQTIKFSQDNANFAKVVKMSPNGKFLVTGSDDLYLRFYEFGACPDNTQFDGFGRCSPISHLALILGLTIGFVLIVIIIIIIWKKKVTIPAQSLLTEINQEPKYLRYNNKQKKDKYNKQKNSIKKRDQQQTWS